MSVPGDAGRRRLVRAMGRSGDERVRDDTGYWSQIDTYLRKHTKASLSHSYCPECAAKFYEECGIEVPDKVLAEIKAGNFE